MLREILRMRIELKAGLKKCKKAQRKAEKKRLEEEEAERQRFLASLEGERFRIHEAKRFRFWFRLFFSP